MIHFSNVNDFFKYIFDGYTYTKNNIVFSCENNELKILHAPTKTIIYARTAFEQLFAFKTYKIINSESLLTPQIQIALLILDHIKLNKICKTNNLTNIVNNDIRIDIKVESIEGELKTGTLMYKENCSITLTKYRRLKNYYYDILLTH